MPTALKQEVGVFSDQFQRKSPRTTFLTKKMFIRSKDEFWKMVFLKLIVLDPKKL